MLIRNLNRRCLWSALERVTAIAFVLACSNDATAANWAQWRGPFFNGSTTESNLPGRLTKTDHLQWSAPLPGPSGATPIVWGDSVFVTSADRNKDLLLCCVDRRTGKVRWQQQVGTGDRVIGKNNMASPSPVTDGQRVFALFGTSDFGAYDFSGKRIWHRRLRDEFGGFAHMFLYGASPLLHDGKLYVPILQRNPPTYGHATDLMPQRKSWLVCIDPADGRTLWAHERKTDAREEAMEAYTTPIPWATPRGLQLVLSGADAVTAHDPKSGTEIWRYTGLNRTRNTGGRIVPSVVCGPELVYAIGPKREKLVALRAPASGLASEQQVVWTTNQFIPDVSTPLFYQGKLFMLDGDRQALTCFEPQTGKVRWQGRLGIREIFYSSPTGADGKIFCLSEQGTLLVASAGEKFQVLSTTGFGEGPCRASVVICDGQFFLRTAQHLYCLSANKL